MQLGAKEHQTLLDIAIQQAGSIEALFDIAEANGLSVTEDLVSGQQLIIFGSAISEKIKNYYSTKNLNPASNGSSGTIVFIGSSPLAIHYQTTEIPEDQVKAKEFQTLLDIAIQEAGSIEALFDLAEVNELGVTDALISGDLIKVVDIINEPIQSFYKQKQFKPASIDITTELPEGIEFWGIEYDFIVN